MPQAGFKIITGPKRTGSFEELPLWAWLFYKPISVKQRYEQAVDKDYIKLSCWCNNVSYPEYRSGIYLTKNSLMIG